MTDDVPLIGGRMTEGLVRRGGHVLRPMGTWTPAVHEYLRYLAAAGFTGAPRVAGIEGDREVLTYVEGDVAVDPEWRPGRGHRLPAYARGDRALTGAAELIRRLHTAAAGFRPAITEYRFHPHPPRPGEIVSHGDLGPWNTVYRDGVPVAFIDFDAARPVEPIIELAAAAWAYVPLAPARRLREAGFEPPPDLPGRLRRFVDAYGLADRRSILPALQGVKVLGAEQIATWPIGPAGAAGALEFVAGELRWLDGVIEDLGRAL